MCVDHGITYHDLQLSFIFNRKRRDGLDPRAVVGANRFVWIADPYFRVWILFVCPSRSTLTFALHGLTIHIPIGSFGYGGLSTDRHGELVSSWTPLAQSGEYDVIYNPTICVKQLVSERGI